MKKDQIYEKLASLTETVYHECMQSTTKDKDNQKL